MAVRVTMPQLGESVVEGTVSKWLKREGDPVSVYEPLLEVSTDKVDSEIPAPAEGVLLKIYVAEGRTVERGTLLALIGQPGENAPPASDGDHHADAAGTADPATMLSLRPEGEVSPYGQVIVENIDLDLEEDTTSGPVTPVVARMVAEHRIDLSKVRSTGRDGRVTKKDIEAYLAAQSAPPPPWEQPGSGDLFKPSVEYGAADSAPAPGAASPTPAAPGRVHPVESIPAGAAGELVPLTAMRKAIAEHMVRSKLHTAPHVTTVFEVDMSAALAHREAHLAEFAKQGVNLTLTAYFAAATVKALQANPYLNARWTENGIYLNHAVHLGIAVALDEGLIVPVIRSAGDLNLLGLARAINDLASRARARQLQPDETQNGTFTISNHGVGGSLLATPIINQPQVGILGVGIVEKRVKVINDAIAIRSCAYITLTFDHRVADGAAGDAFLLTLKRALEGWA